MTQQTIRFEGALTADTRAALNANFNELYAVAGGGTVTGAQNALSINRAPTINALGDSLSAISIYQPTVLDATKCTIPPQWLANTAYVLNQQVVNNGLYYRCITAGTSAASGGPTGVATSVADNTAAWAYSMPQSQKNSREMLYWIESLSLGELQWNQWQGNQSIYGGLVRAVVVNGGSNYSGSDTVTLTNGARASITISGGVITACTVTNPGFSTLGDTTITINTATGSGARIALIQSAAGTFAGAGLTTADIVAPNSLLSAAAASSVDIFTVHIGVNDVKTGIGYAAITANIKTIYETLAAAGKRVVAIPIFPSDSSLITASQQLVLQRVNRWIRAFYTKQTWANPNQVNILIADNTRYMTDGSSTSNSPIGAATGAARAMTVDGIHQSQRGAFYLGMSVINALAVVIGTLNTTASRVAGMADGYSPSYNPSGNVLEGIPWTTATAYALGDHVASDTAPVKIYVCVQAGTSSTAPTGTGTNIVDNTVRWNYLRTQGLSVWSPALSVTPTAAAGIAYTGLVPDNCVYSRANGSASGTVTFAKESPWSDGQIGQRLVVTHSLGSGSNAEQHQLYVNHFGATNLGIETAALGRDFFYVEMEFELSGVANMLHPPSIGLSDNFANGGTFQTEVGRELAQGSGANYTMPQSTSEMLPLPNSGKFYVRSEPMIIPTNQTNPFFVIRWQFNASGGAGSATCTTKINHIALRKAYQA